MRFTSLAALTLSLLAIVPAALADDAPPFAQALDAAKITVPSLDNIHDQCLILGNGDVNGLLFSRGRNLVLRLTKNDVWDARIDTSQDPPLLKIDVKNKKLEGNPAAGVPSWDKPYPCPRACAEIVIGPDRSAPAAWRPHRAEGEANAFEFRDGSAVMTIRGRREASNGWRLDPLSLSTSDYSKITLRISGSANARYFVELDAADGQNIFSSRWIDAPRTPETRAFDLPAGKTVGQLVLYTWTTDGAPAENRFSEVTFEGPKGKLPIELNDLKADTGGGQASLDIRRAVAEVKGANATLRSLAQRNVFVIQCNDEAKLAPVPAAYLPKPESGQRDGVQWITQQLPADPDWPGMTFAVALASTNDRKAAAIVTSLESRDCLADAIALAKSALAEDPAKQVAEHESIWRKFWSASGVELDDPTLQNLWYRNLYFLRCVSKPGVEAVGLYAGLVSDSPAWHGSHTLNYNSEQTFSTCYATNHVELAEPYERMIFRYLPRARWFAKQAYGFDGAHIPHNVFAHETFDPANCKSRNNRMHAVPPYAYTIGNSGFAVQNLWWHYKYQPDREYLEKIAYPAVHDVALFYANFVERCEPAPGAGGKVVLAPSYSPEHWSLSPDFARNRNCAFDIAFVRFTLAAAIEGATILGRDSADVERFKSAMAKLPEYPTTHDNPPIVVDVQDAPPIAYNIAIPAVPVWPAEQVTWFSPDAERQLFARSIESLDRTLKWGGYNSSIILCFARARLSMPDAWKWVRDAMAFRSRPNGTTTLLPGDPLGNFTEQFAISAAISELMLQSVGDTLRIFPAWPKDKPARFADLRAHGGFLVSAEQSDGQVRRLTITSTVGGKLRLLSPWPIAIVQSDTGPSRTLTADARGIVELDTRAGEKLAFTGK